MIPTATDFGPDFTWGVSTAAYQIEGAHNHDGKGASIWDDFTARKQKLLKGQSGNVSCDFYNRYHDDLGLMAAMNIPNYRFSLAWSRLLPEGMGNLNPAGADYYDRHIDRCLELGIEPWVTLYHWDLPLALQQKGGWTNRDVISWFSDYTDFCVSRFGDRVKNWMVLNEPMVFTGAGYFLGVHAPGKKGLSNFLASAHHAAMCQSAGARIIRQLNPSAKVGTTFSYSHVEAASDKERDLRAAGKVDAILNRFYLEPLLGLGYPTRELPLLNRIERYMKPGDDALLPFDMDFIGVQNYTREIVKFAPFRPFIRASIVKADKRNVERTLMNWEVYPQSIYRALQRIASYPSVKEILVTENGAAFSDEVRNGEVKDHRRTAYLQNHIAQVLRDKQEGINVTGYFVWTFMDNFEWAEGYHPRFGLVHVDFETQERIVKDSGKWYSSFLRNDN
ncbi:MAG: GH1 family beta-glucosidase [Bacteroidota bacterium]